MKSFICILLLLSLTIASINSQNRLIVPYTGSWNFEVRRIDLSSSNLIVGQQLKIVLEAQCLESSDNSGYIRIRLRIKSEVTPEYIEDVDVNLMPAGRTESYTFYYTPQQPGYYNVTVEIFGGAFYLWHFHRAETSFSVQRQTQRYDLTRLPAGIRMLEPIKNGRYTYFTFELEPSLVNKAADDFLSAEQYVRHMIWIIANNRWNNIDQNIIIAIAVAIYTKAQELHHEAKQYRGQYLQMQYICDDLILPGLEFVRALESILSAVKFIHQANLIRHLPYIDPSIYY